MTNIARRGTVARLVTCGLLLAVASVFGAVQSSTVAYPTTYSARQLPELPGATVVSIGRQTDSLRDGLRIRLTSSKPLAEVREFYQNALVAGGWREYHPPAARATRTSMRIDVISFVKERLTYEVTIVVPPNTAETQVTIKVVER